MKFNRERLTHALLLLAPLALVCALLPRLPEAVSLSWSFGRVNFVILGGKLTLLAPPLLNCLLGFWLSRLKSRLEAGGKKGAGAVSGLMWSLCSVGGVASVWILAAALMTNSI
ncbi:MAG: hypothetical protein LBU36_07725 [Clostridiales bacterium]|nr:hypothetical protein [Clostridiales bacterium]